MKTCARDKTISLEELRTIVTRHKTAGRTVVQTHGVFDVIHPGIVRHLQEAAAMGDILVATVIRDKDVRRGPGRPVFPEHYRAGVVAELGMIDYVCVVDDEIPFECVKLLQPTIFAKGQAYRERDRALHEQVFIQERDLHLGKCELMETQGFSFSASAIIAHFLEIHPLETCRIARSISAQYAYSDIAAHLARLEGLKVLVLGDGIVDQYHYCTPMGKSAKAQLVVNRTLTLESFAGGAFAVANHVAAICGRVTLVSLLGAEDETCEEVIRKGLKSAVTPVLFRREDAPTIVKKRYVDSHTRQKLFEVNDLRDEPISGELEKRLLDYLEAHAADFDLVMVADFGHGLVTPRIISLLRQVAQRLAVNTQTNAANRGFNLITRYQAPDLACLDEEEARLAVQDKVADITQVAETLYRELGCGTLFVTTGRTGSVAMGPDQNMVRTPALSTRVVDPVGAGDAVFAYVAPCVAAGVPTDLTAFIANAVGALAVQIVCNRESVERFAVLEFLKSLLHQACSDDGPWYGSGGRE